MTSVNIDYIDQAIDELICQFGVKEPVSSAPIYTALNAGKTQECLTIIANYLGLPVVIDLSAVELAAGSQSHDFGEKFESTAIVSAARPAQAGKPAQPAQSITAQVFIPSRLPIYGTSGLQDFHLRVKVSDNCQKYPKTFAAVMAHEFSHIVLHSILHNKSDNEFYTDLTAMILGFSEIFREGRKTVETKQFSSKTITTTTTYGYLSDELFNFAFDKIKNALIEFRKTDRELQDKIQNKVATYKTLVLSYEEKRELLRKLLENLDKNPKKISKDDAAGIVRMHQLYFLEGLADNGKRHLHTLNGISESSQTIKPTSLYSKKRLNYLTALLQRIENSIFEIEKESDSIENDISLLEKNTSFFVRHRIKHQFR